MKYRKKMNPENLMRAFGVRLSYNGREMSVCFERVVIESERAG